LYITTYGGGSDSSTFTTPSQGDWFFFALVGSGTGAGGVTGYIGTVTGTTLESQSATGVSFTESIIWVGDNGWSEGGTFTLDGLQIYDRALSAAELAAQWRVRRPLFQSNLNVWLPMLDKTSTTAQAQDYSGNGRNATDTSLSVSSDNAPVSWGAPLLLPNPSADTTAPVLSSPTGTATGPTTATIGATTDEGNGTLYGVVTTSATQPSVAQIKAGQDHTGAAAAWGGSQSISSTGANTLNATGLTASTGYYGHLVHTDAAANDSNRVSSSQFTTDAVSLGPRLFPHGPIGAGPSYLFLLGTATGSGSFSGPITETVTLTDSQSVTAVFVSTAEETVTLTDSQSSTKTTSGDVAESVTLTDSQTASLTFSGSITESVTLTEAVSSTATFLGIAAESLTLSDSQSSTAVFSGSLEETITLTDAQTGEVPGGNSYSGPIEESVSLADSQSVTVVWVGVAEESLTLTDSVSASALFLGAVGEELTLTDAQSASVFGSLDGPVEELLTFSDAYEATLIPGASTDTGGGGGHVGSRWRRRPKRLVEELLEERDETPTEAVATVVEPLALSAEALSALVEALVNQEKLSTRPTRMWLNAVRARVQQLLEEQEDEEGMVNVLLF
jgi:hypothetical protein